MAGFITQATRAVDFEDCLRIRDQSDVKDSLQSVCTISEINAIIDSKARMNHASPETDKSHIKFHAFIQLSLLW